MARAIVANHRKFMSWHWLLATAASATAKSAPCVSSVQVQMKITQISSWIRLHKPAVISMSALRCPYFEKPSDGLVCVDRQALDSLDASLACSIIQEGCAFCCHSLLALPASAYMARHYDLVVSLNRGTPI